MRAGHSHDTRLLEQQVVAAHTVIAKQFEGPEVAQLLEDAPDVTETSCPRGNERIELQSR